MNNEFRMLCKKCPRLKTLLKEQRENTLSKDRWSAAVRILIDAGRIALARTFTEQSGKRDYAREEYIDKLSIQRPEGNVLCRELGCSEEVIEQRWSKGGHCFEEKCPQDEKGGIIFSPVKKLQLDYREKINIGFDYKAPDNTKSKKDDKKRTMTQSNDEENTDIGFDYEAPEQKKADIMRIKLKYSGMNPNTYAAFILKNYNFMLHESNRYYIYYGNCWKVFHDFKMQRLLRNFFHKFEPGEWRTTVQFNYMSTLRLECWDTDDLQSAERYINVKNGLLDLDTETIVLKPHDKKVFSTTQIPIRYDEKAKCPEFINFLKVTFGEKNKNLINLVQEIMGYCLSNSVKAHKMFIFLGSGSNGKSVLCEVMTALAGGIENVSSVALKDFSHRFALSQIADRTLNISMENETTVKLDTQMLKSITSGEPVQMEEKFQAPFSYRPYIKLVFAMNSLPYVKDKSYGFERRLVVIPFEKRFVDHDPKYKGEIRMDRNLADTLIKEELSGIFTFAIEGLKRLRKNDFVFTKSRKAEKALEKYKEKIDPYWVFVREYVTADKTAINVNVTEFRNHFHKWCRDEGHSNYREVSAQTFTENMERVFPLEGIRYQKIKSGKYFLTGIRVIGLNAPSKEEESDDGDTKSDNSIDDFFK